MTKFAFRDAVEMLEMLRDSACMIDHFTEYINQCQDPQLRQILENQQRRLVGEYQHKVEVMQGHGIDLTNMPRLQSVNLQGAGSAGTAGAQGTAAMTGVYGGPNIQFGIQQPGTIQAQQQSQQQFRQQSQQWALNDRTIVQGALLFHKCGAARATAAALESAEPHLRNLAANSARVCVDMAYEIFRYMHQKGFYQMPEIPANFISHVQVPGTQAYPGMQQVYYGGRGVQEQLS